MAQQIPTNQEKLAQEITNLLESGTMTSSRIKERFSWRGEIESKARQIDSIHKQYHRKARSKIQAEGEWEESLAYQAIEAVACKKILEAIGWDRIGIQEVENVFLLPMESEEWEAQKAQVADLVMPQRIYAFQID